MDTQAWHTDEIERQHLIEFLVEDQKKWKQESGRDHPKIRRVFERFDSDLLLSIEPERSDLAQPDPMTIRKGKEKSGERFPHQQEPERERERDATYFGAAIQKPVISSIGILHPIVAL